jgi:HD-GYP domain-containing protein (c-di-GMP phosphodiesterase class II)
MSSTIAVEELCVGMFIHLEGGWLSHPFPLSSFRLATSEQIATLRGLGLKRVRWVPEKSDAPQAPGGSAASAAAQITVVPSAQERAAQQRREQLTAQREATQRCERQHTEAAQAWREAHDATSSRPQDAGRTTEALTRAMLDKMLASDEVAIRLVSGGGDRTAAHALNVTVIALLIGRTLEFTPDELLDLGVGALMHDVGKQDVPDRLRHLEDGFSAAEANAYRDHVARGVAQGQRMALSAGALAVLAQHHEHADGSGFPHKLVGQRIAMAARLVAIVNRFDNLCNPQARTLALTPHEAVSVLFAQGRNRFDATVLNGFIRMMGVYPAGSLVQLTDDRFAIVVGVNSSRPLKPRVLVYDPRMPRSEALMLDLEREPDLGIRRSLAANKLPVPALDYLDPRPRVAYYFEPLERPLELAA